MTWDDASSVKNAWLQVTVLPTSRTGLFLQETFYIGSAIGETGNATGSTRVDATDQVLTRNNQRTLLNPASITDRYDFNRDKKVDATDQIIARNHQTTFITDLKRLQAPLNPVSGLQSRSIDSQTLHLTWQDNSKHETGYSIQLADQNGSYQEVHRPIAGSTAASISGLAASGNYSFRVVPLSGSADSPTPSLAQARSIAGFTNPLASESEGSAGIWSPSMAV